MLLFLEEEYYPWYQLESFWLQIIGKEQPKLAPLTTEVESAFPEAMVFMGTGGPPLKNRY